MAVTSAGSSSRISINVSSCPPNARFQPRRHSIVAAAVGCKPMLAGTLKSQNFLADGLGKIDESELVLAKQIVLSAFVDDA